MKKLLIKLLFLTPIIIFIACFNLYVDPAKLFSKGDYEIGIANYLNENKNVENLSDYDERLLQEYLIEGFDSPREVVVLGSSRAMQINKDMFPGRTFINNSVSGATFEDILGLYELYRAKDLLPKSIILGLDPWYLNRNHGQVRWKTLGATYDMAMQRLGLDPADVAGSFLEDLIPYRYLELLSPSYFQQSFKMLREGQGTSYYPTTDTVGEHNIKLTDGSLSYNFSYSNASAEEINRKATEEALENPIYSLGGFTQLDQNYINTINALVKDYLDHGGKLVFYLAPFHPKFYELMINNEKYKIVSDAEIYFRTLAKNHDIPVVGAFDPAKLSLSGNDFYDGMHLKRSATEYLFTTNQHSLD